MLTNFFGGIEMRRKILTLCIAAIILSAVFSPCYAKEYRNARFGFAISIYDSWWRYKNPDPVNNDGISFSFPGKAYFSVSGCYNVLNRTLKEEAAALTEGGEIIKQNKRTIDGMPAIITLWDKDGERLYAASILRKGKDGNEIFYTIYYKSLKKDFHKFNADAGDAMATFRKLEFGK